VKIEEVLRRIDELIELANRAMQNRNSNFQSYVSTEVAFEYRSAVLSFLLNTFGKEHPFYKEFESNGKGTSTHYIEMGRGILKAAKSEIEGGWIFTVKNLISAEIFSDFLEMAEYLLSENYKDSAAVMIGSVLEEHLRNLCNKNNINVVMIKGGKTVPKKADLLNSELAAVSVYNKLDQKSVTSWLDLRNKAAHGKYEEYTKDQVSIMYSSVTDFMARTAG